METFGAALRRHRERRGLTQEAAAALVEVSRATFTQWESNKHLPSPLRAVELDRALDADGTLVNALEAARGSRVARLRPAAEPDAPAPEGPTVYQVKKDVRRALLDQMCFDEDGRALGWRHQLVSSEEPVSTMSTIYGIGALALLGGPDQNTPAIIERILGIGVDPDGRIRGWKARAQRKPRFDVTATGLKSLLGAGVRLSADAVLGVLERLLDDTAQQRPFALTIGLETVQHVASESALAQKLVRLLLDCRIEFDGVLLWPEKRRTRTQLLLEASVAHTARAIAVLRDAPEDLVGDAVAQAEEWLAVQTNLGGVTEVVRRSLPDDDMEELSFHHFTSALVVKALAGAQRPDRTAIRRALNVVWERYDRDSHLWAWGNGDVPVWLLSDAIGAVLDAAAALATVPVLAETDPS